MIQEDSIILAHQQIGPKYFRLTLQSKHISENAVPGQFIEVRVTNKTSPLLRKPFSLHKIDKTNNCIEILYEIVGTGTNLLSEKKAGEKLNILGPLGNGFTIDPDKTAILVGGGMGIAPLLALANTIRMKHPALPVFVFIGGRSSEYILCSMELESLSTKITISTDNGTLGNKGFVSNSLTDFINNPKFDSQLATIYACGPHAMLKAIADIANQNNIDCQISTEAYMACGIGACKGCAVKTKSGYKMACKDGPIFSAKELIWN